MVISVTGTAAQQEALRQSSSEGIVWKQADSPEEAAALQPDAIFYLHDDAADRDFSGVSQPVFVNSLLTTLGACNAPQAAGISGWPYSLSRQSWEAAGELTGAAEAVAAALGKTLIPVPDVPGFITPRVIAAIINEAYFALEDGVSSREDMDTAMKLGTNYPHGPFEWTALIGAGNVYRLLQTLAAADDRYTPAALLKKEATA